MRSAPESQPRPRCASAPAGCSRSSHRRSPRRGSRGRQPRRALGKPAIALLAFMIGGAVGAALHAVWTRAPQDRVVYLDRPATIPPDRAPDLRSWQWRGGPRLRLRPRPRPRRRPRPRPRSRLHPRLRLRPRPRSRPQSSASGCRAERVLLDEARAALAQGNLARALDRPEHHRRRFPRRPGRRARCHVDSGPGQGRTVMTRPGTRPPWPGGATPTACSRRGRRTPRFGPVTSLGRLHLGRSRSIW